MPRVLSVKRSSSLFRNGACGAARHSSVQALRSPSSDPPSRKTVSRARAPPAHGKIRRVVIPLDGRSAVAQDFVRGLHDGIRRQSPVLADRLMLPRELTMRMPSDSAASNCAASRSPAPLERHSDGQSRSCSRTSSVRPYRKASSGVPYLHSDAPRCRRAR